MVDLRAVRVGARQARDATGFDFRIRIPTPAQGGSLLPPVSHGVGEAPTQPAAREIDETGPQSGPRRPAASSLIAVCAS